VPIPAALLAPIDSPPFRGSTNGDLWSWAIELRGAINQCAANLRAIRIYVDESEPDGER